MKLELNVNIRWPSRLTIAHVHEHETAPDTGPNHTQIAQALVVIDQRIMQTHQVLQLLENLIMTKNDELSAAIAALTQSVGTQIQQVVDGLARIAELSGGATAAQIDEQIAKLNALKTQLDSDDPVVEPAPEPDPSEEPPVDGGEDGSEESDQPA